MKQKPRTTTGHGLPSLLTFLLRRGGGGDVAGECRRSSAISFVSTCPSLAISDNSLAAPPLHVPSKLSVVQAAWTRSRGEMAKRPDRKSWKQRTDMYMRPFSLNVFFSKRFIHAKAVHRGTSKVISVASTNAKDLRNTLPSLINNEACCVVGRLIADRSMEADVFAVAYEPKKDELIEGRLGIVLDAIKDCGIIFVYNLFPSLLVG